MKTFLMKTSLVDNALSLLRRKFVQDTLILQLSKIGVAVLGLAAWVIVPVRLGPHEYGLFVLAQSFLSVWLTLDLTGLNVGIPILLSAAVGAKDERAILDLLAVYVKVATIWGLFTLAVLLTLGPALAALLYREPVAVSAAHTLSYLLLAGVQTAGRSYIGALAAVLALAQLFDPIYNMFLSAFRSRRTMRQVAVMQNVNQFVLTICLVSAALISPTAEGQVIGRIVYSVVTLLIIGLVYQRTRGDGAVQFPSVRAILRRTVRVSYRPYWRYGLESALDKNLSVLFAQIPLQLVGILAGPSAASYIQLGLRGINRASIFTSAVYENIQAVIPQAVGRRDYARLWRNFLRVLAVLALGGLAFYTLLVLVAPLLLAPIFGKEWEPVLPLLPVFAIYGLATTVGGVFGPLYRAFDLMRQALLTKIITLLVMIPLGVWLIQQAGALGGVWMLNGLFVLSILFTAAFTLPVLYRHAQQTAGASE
jgi:O-antigen/teichoic acid export membrane protein